MATWRAPTSVQNVPCRPLDKGIIRDRAPQVIPDGGFFNLEDFIAGSEGLKRRAGYMMLAGGNRIPYKVVDMITLWKDDGTQENLALTEETLWRVYRTSVAEVPWVRTNVGTVEIDGDKVTGIGGTLWLESKVKKGDFFRVEIEGITTEVKIKSVTSNTELILEDSILDDYTGVYTIQGTFSPGYVKMPDWTLFDNKLIIADGKNPLIMYDADSGVLQNYVPGAAQYPSGNEFIAGCVAGFENRIFCGDILDGVDGRTRNMIRWSALADPQDFSTLTSFLYMPETKGSLLRMVPLGSSLIAYFTDSIRMGVSTNYPLLPVRFETVETGGNGLIGPRAITSFAGGHFFVGQDGMYLLTEQGPENIGMSVFRETVMKCKQPWYVRVAMDPSNYSIAFGFPVTKEYVEKIWRWDYRTKAWSSEDTKSTMLANPNLEDMIGWDDPELSGITWNTIGSLYRTWGHLNLDDPRKYMYSAYNGYMYRLTLENTSDELGGLGETLPITASLVSKDHDYDDMGGLKTWVQLSVKINDATEIPRTVPIVFGVAVSVDRGKTYKGVGDMTIPVGKDEGFVNFRATGSTMRFKMWTSSVVPPYFVTEYDLKMRSIGREWDASNQ